MTYDDLGRVKSITRGNSGGTVSYGYNLHGQTVSISGPGFSQSLHYADGPGTKCYNGSVSAMTWNMGNDATTRGYKYTYNAYNWLTNAEYGEGSSISSNKNRYSEKFTGFMRNGGVTALQRHGLRPDGTYGMVDNLSITYDGNRVQSVSDAAPAITQPGSMDYPGGSSGNVFSYNSWGALEKDTGRGITSVTYDNLGNPQQISYSDQSYTRHVYSSSGDKLKSVHHSTPSLLSLAAMGGTATKVVSAAAGQETFEYRGQVIYRNGAVHMVLFPGGYATISGSTVTFHYYTQDYLGNNRAVVNGSTGAIEQTTAYYPYGGVIADLGSGNSGQPFKFGGKELVTANGLNEYDFGARRYFQAIPHFTSIDPLCEKYYWLSPYLYCANNPVNLVDLNGETPNMAEAARMADYVYGKEKVKLTGGWKPSERQLSKVNLKDDKTGLKSMLFERTVDGITEYAYAFAGTDPTSLKDWKNNIQQLHGNSKQCQQALKNAENLTKNINEELTFVGHSLGGGLAAASAYATGGHAITFNAAGVSTQTVDMSSGAQIDAYVINHDELHLLQSNSGLPVANGKIIFLNGNASIIGHSIKNFYEPSMASQIQFKVESIFSTMYHCLRNFLNPYRKY